MLVRAKWICVGASGYLMLMAGVSASSVKLPVVQPPDTLLVLALTLVTCNDRGHEPHVEGGGSRAVQQGSMQRCPAHFCRTRSCMGSLGSGSKSMFMVL